MTGEFHHLSNRIQHFPIGRVENIVSRVIPLSIFDSSINPYLEFGEHPGESIPYYVHLCLPLKPSGALHCRVGEFKDELSGRKAYERVVKFLEQNEGDIFLEDSVELITHEGKGINLYDSDASQLEFKSQEDFSDILAE